ncbi:SMYD [Acanthosepion pharaonis]|uniref:SMYD n=1 Tax=Acanthosepion pharaonis TaxID=158019 RepID=A0A812BN91_ACAPH|nr:SMYD [Sepia pharaonis]
MLINSFLIPDEYLNKIGTGLYLSTSKLDHCCAPNCVYTYNGTEQIIRALTYIEQPSPDKMFVTYIDNAMPSWERRLQLNENYYFYCQCSWCVDEAKHIDRLMTSVKCPNSWCFGFSGITKDDTGQTQLLSCSGCGKTDFPVEYAREIVRLVREMAKGACIELKLWQKAVEYGELAWTQKIKCVPHPSPSLGLQLFEQGKLLTNTGNIDKAWEIFLKAANILQITHGTENNMYLELEDLIEQCEIVLDLPV